MMDFVGVTPGHFGDLLPPGRRIGPLSAEGAAAAGLTGRTQAVSGSMDQAIGAVGAGNILPGMITESTGGALGIVASIEKPVFDPQRRLPCYFHAIQGRYCLLPWGQTAGMALRWFRDEFYRRELAGAQSLGHDPYDLMTSEAAGVPPGQTNWSCCRTWRAPSARI
jgi:xylulokinase